MPNSAAFASRARRAGDRRKVGHAIRLSGSAKRARAEGAGTSQ